MKIKERVKYNQPDVYCKLTENYCKLLPEDDSLTTFFERIERTLDPICDAIRKAMRRFEINI